MNKPITILRDEFVQTVVNAINESHLPAFVLADSLEPMVATLRQQEMNQLVADKEKFEAETKEETESE